MKRAGGFSLVILCLFNQATAAQACEPQQHLRYSGCHVQDMGLSEDANHAVLHLNLGHCKSGDDLDMDFTVNLRDPVDKSVMDLRTYSRIWRSTLRELAKKARFASQRGKSVQFDAVCSPGKDPKATLLQDSEALKVLD
jgi:hypothetical protein